MITAPNHNNRAVQYLRMSTEHQRYSLENQASAIAVYATERGLNIVRTYSDPGRSGLTLKERPGLQRLLSDALRDDRDFSVVVVFDVSRWGRFQDPDQSAHYEYLVREAGVQVAYCGEPFENDGSAVSAILKQLKRVMAAEYSRELSMKVSRAHHQQALLGYWQGGPASYGFQRVLLGAHGGTKRVLDPHEAKATREDRVLVVPGPPREVAVVRRIFRLYTATNRRSTQVAQALNDEGHRFRDGTLWSATRVLGVLNNELCIGRYVWNRTDQRMSGGRRQRPPSEWVRVKVGEPTVSVQLFNKARRKLNQRGGPHRAGQSKVTDSDLLDALRALLGREGRLSGDLISADPMMLGDDTYRRRFGSLQAAYKLVGYTQPTAGRVPDPQARDDTHILEGVRRLYLHNGYVSARLISEDQSLPGLSSIYRRFGSLIALYEQAGLAGNAMVALRLGTRDGNRRRLLRIADDGKGASPTMSPGPAPRKERPEVPRALPEPRAWEAFSLGEAEPLLPTCQPKSGVRQLRDE